MKLITRETDYTIRSLCYISKVGKKIVSVSELVKRLRIPRPFLRKLLQILSKKGILRSIKGLGGGFKLVIQPDKIFLLDLIQIFQGPLSLNECFFKKIPCPNKKKCVLRKKINKIQQVMIRELKPISIASLLGG